MKKYIIIIILAMLALPLEVEAQRKSGSRSSKSKSTSVRTSSSKKSSSSSSKAVRSTPSVKRSSPAVRSSSRNSSSSSRTVVKSTPRSSSSNSRSAVRTTPRSSSSRTVVRTNPGNNSRSSTAVRSSISKTVTSRNNTARQSEVRTNPSAQVRNNSTNRSPGQRSASFTHGNETRRVAPGTERIYHSSRRFIRERPVRYRYKVVPHPRDYRARYYPYRHPVYFHIYWSYNIFRHYCVMYPVMNNWTYYSDYSISTISAYDALFNIGEVCRVYGKVSEVYYALETDEFFLYFGAYYPHHDFTVVIPGEVARRYSRNPEFYFMDEHVEVTGLITEYEDKPEVVVKEKNQLKRY